MFQHINEYKRPQYIYKGRNEGFRAVPSIKLPKTKPIPTPAPATYKKIILFFFLGLYHINQ